jgi:hypothetical protein
MNVIIALAFKGSILMIAAAAIIALLFRASAATRHFVWTLSVLGLLLLPLFAVSLPRWEIAVSIASVEAGSYAVEPASPITPSPMPTAVTGALPTTPVDTESSVSIRVEHSLGDAASPRLCSGSSRAPGPARRAAQESATHRA